MKLRYIIFSIFFLILFTKQTFAAETFIITPSSKEISVGETFSVIVYVSSPSQAINAVSGSLKISGGANASSVTKNSSIVNFWTTEPKVISNYIRFEGVVLNPGYQGQNGRLFTASFSARKEGPVTLSFFEGSILANDGLGSNIIDSLPSITINIKPAPIIIDNIPVFRPIASSEAPINTNKIVALPVITDYSESVSSRSKAYLKGKGEPNALTKLVFKEISIKSLGEQFVNSLQTKKNQPIEALVKNDNDGFFQYLSAENLVAGAYNVTPFLVDQETQTQKPGFGIQLLVNNSKVVKILVVFINILALMIPIVSLGVIIYFIPWYSRLRMKILNHKINLEDKELTLSEKKIEAKELLLDKK